MSINSYGADVTGDRSRKRTYETALARCLADPVQVQRLTEAELCHGAGGVYQTTWRVARDAETSEPRDRLPAMADLLLRNARRSLSDPGFLDGDAGVALALHTAATDEEPISKWDACLLVD